LLLLNRNRKHVTDVVAKDRKLPNIKELWQMTSTFAFVTFAWVFFRADGMKMALSYIKNIGLNLIEQPNKFFHLYYYQKYFFSVWIYIFILIILDWQFRENERNYKIGKLLIIVFAVLSILILFRSYGNNTGFIYFQF
jgi:hypothetical protein